MSGDIKGTYLEEDNKLDVEETSINLACVKKEPNEDVLDFDENSDVKQYRIAFEYVNILGGTSGFKFEENGDNLIGFVDNDVIMENTIIKLENVKDESLNNFHCSKCKGYYKDYCLKCSTLSCILNNNMSLLNSNSELNSIPTDILEIRETSMGKGVFLLRTLPKDVIFGPFEGLSGIKTTEGCSWKVKDKKLLSIDNGNWMKDVSAADALLKNLDIFQIDNSLYFRTNREILEGEELLVYYADEEIEKLVNSKECLYTPQKQEKLPKIFACVLCCLAYGSDECLMEHKRKCPRLDQSRSIKDFELIECHYCKMWMEKWEHEEYHIDYCMEKHHRMRYHQIETSVEQIENHLGTKKDKRVYRCELCLKTYDWKDALQLPVKQMRVKEFTNDDQGFSGIKQENKYTLEDTNYEHEGNIEWKCLECFYQDNCKRNLKLQINTNNDTKPFKCSICSTVYTTKYAFKRHLKMKHTENGVSKDYKCSKCNYQTNIKIYLRNHLNMHKGIKPFECNICLMKFTHKGNLKTHVKNKHRENGERDYKCPKCSFQTNFKHHFQYHLNTHKGVKPFQCDICMIKFSQKYHLKTHTKNKHTENVEKRYKCSVCYYQTNYGHRFQNHLTTHNGIKPFECNICMMKFTQKDNLKTHIKNKHTENCEKLYKCSDCIFQTIYKHSFQNHRNTHSGVKPFQCDICMSKFTQKNNLHTHIKKKHTKNCEKD